MSRLSIYPFLIILVLNPPQTTIGFSENKLSEQQGRICKKEIFCPYSPGDSNKIRIISNYDKIKSLAELLDGFKGKTVFIDLWATWCGPCFEEFKFSEPLHDFLAKEQVEMVYVSFDKDAEDALWRKKLRENKLSGNHIRANKMLRDDITTLVWGAPDAFSIPHYLLFDSKKKLISKDLSRPSETLKLYKEIQSASN